MIYLSSPKAEFILNADLPLFVFVPADLFATPGLYLTHTLPTHHPQICGQCMGEVW
jgi:hypothetical protein